MRHRSSFFEDAAGFVIGFFFGCCGLVLTGLFARDYFRGAVAGVVASIVLGTLSGLVRVTTTTNTVTRIDPDGGSVFRDVPWELVGAFGIVTVFVLGTIAGAIWAFGGRGDDPDDDPPARRPDPNYVSFDRR